MTLRIRNWEIHQHFTNRRPPWVKLYRALLDDMEFISLSGDDSKTLILLWLLASEDKSQTGELPPVAVCAFRLRTTETKLKQALTRLSHWVIQCVDNLPTDCTQTVTPERETETETETETEGEGADAPARKKSAKGTRFDGLPLRTEWLDWAIAFGCPSGKAFDEYDKFSDYWQAIPGAKGVKLDWLATWRNWIRRSGNGKSRADTVRSSSPAPRTRGANGQIRWDYVEPSALVQAAQALNLDAAGQTPGALAELVKAGLLGATADTQKLVMEMLR